jgi:hypothetical protein
MKIVPLVAAFAMVCTAATANAPLRYVTFLPAGYGEFMPEYENVDGIAMLRYNANTGWSRLNIMIQGLQPQKMYAVQVGGTATPTSTQIGCAIQTNTRGSGAFATELPGDFGPDAAIMIFVRDEDCFDWEAWEDEAELEEIRAIAIPL